MRITFASIVVLLLPFCVSAADTATPFKTAHPMKIGIISAGDIGGTLARHWGAAGHQLLISSRHPEQLQALAKEIGPNVKVGTPREAAAFGEVVHQYPDTLYVVDSVSGFLGVEVRTDEWGLDVCLTSSQKAFALPPGIAFAARLFSGPALTRLQRMPCCAPAVARLRVNPTTAAFAVAYPTLLGSPNMPDDVVFTMRP